MPKGVFFLTQPRHTRMRYPLGPPLASSFRKKFPFPAVETSPARRSPLQQRVRLVPGGGGVSGLESRSSSVRTATTTTKCSGDAAGCAHREAGCRSARHRTPPRCAAALAHPRLAQGPFGAHNPSGFHLSFQS
jgi:hypothetical protein